MFLYISPNSVVQTIIISHLEYRSLLNGFSASAHAPVQSIFSFFQISAFQIETRSFHSSAQNSIVFLLHSDWNLQVLLWPANFYMTWPSTLIISDFISYLPLTTFPPKEKKKKAALLFSKYAVCGKCLPQGLCTGCAICLENSSPRYSKDSLPHLF